MKLPRFFLLSCLALLAVPALAQEGMSNNAAYAENRMSGLEDQMRELQGRIEQVEYAEKKLEQTLQRLQSDYDARLAKLEAPPPAPAPQASAAQPQPPVADANGTLGSLKMQDGKVTGSTNSPQSPPLPPTPPDYGLTPAEQYERAFSLLRQANYPEAEQAFKAYIQKNPKDKLIDSAKYWYGETLYVRARFDEAAVAFADAYQQNPRGQKAPDSLLKLAMSLGALKKNADACTTLRELKTKYPAAQATIKARADDERAHLKCPKQ